MIQERYLIKGTFEIMLHVVFSHNIIEYKHAKIRRKKYTTTFR